MAVPAGRREPCQCGTQPSSQGDQGVPVGGVLGALRQGRAEAAPGLACPWLPEEFFFKAEGGQAPWVVGGPGWGTGAPDLPRVLTEEPARCGRG